MRLIKPLLFCALLPLQPLLAAGVHQHGSAQLDLVLEPPMLAISVRSPLANLVGFEHRPASAEEQADWQQLKQRLQQAELQIQLPVAADCSLSRVALHQPFMDERPSDGHNHGHDETDRHAHDEEAHADLMVEYHYLCAEPERLKQLELPLMQQFPGIEQLEVQLITPAGQHLRHLSQGEQVLSLP
jgi:hypothetical protein